MKLQCNNSGAWKQVNTFRLQDIEFVKSGVAGLAHAAAKAGDSTTWRILDGAEHVAAYLIDPAKGWDERIAHKDLTP